MKKHEMGRGIFSRFKHSRAFSYTNYDDAYGFRILDEGVFLGIEEGVLAMTKTGENKILVSLTEFRAMDYEET